MGKARGQDEGTVAYAVGYWQAAKRAAKEADDAEQAAAKALVEAAGIRPIDGDFRLVSGGRLLTVTVYSNRIGIADQPFVPFPTAEELDAKRGEVGDG